MINITDKSKCCGCEACVQICPRNCISTYTDDEGFCYPKVDVNLCTGCGLCETVCPIINRYQPTEPLDCYAAKNSDEPVRMASSSGGIFTALAEKTIADGGVVFGARFNSEWRVVHDYTDSIEGLSLFRGSKYLQSSVGNCYRQAQQFLKQGRKVLFSGTPCQIAGLHHFLRHSYPNLFTVDIICHGTPSPKVWLDYLGEIRHPLHSIEGISFRDKHNGWEKYEFSVRQHNTIFSEPFYDNVFMKGFLNNLYLRPSCYSCPAKAGRSHADITLGDFWGIKNFHPQFDDDRGVSAVIINTMQGQMFYNSIQAEQIAVAVDDIIQGNPSLATSVAVPRLRKKFWHKYHTQGFDAVDSIIRLMRPTLYRRIIFNAKRIIRHAKSLLRKQTNH